MAHGVWRMGREAWGHEVLTDDLPTAGAGPVSLDAAAGSGTGRFSVCVSSSHSGRQSVVSVQHDERMKHARAADRAGQEVYSFSAA